MRALTSGDAFRVLALLLDLLAGHLQFLDVVPLLVERVGQPDDQDGHAHPDEQAEDDRGRWPS